MCNRTVGCRRFTVSVFLFHFHHLATRMLWPYIQSDMAKNLGLLPSTVHSTVKRFKNSEDISLHKRIETTVEWQSAFLG